MDRRNFLKALAGVAVVAPVSMVNMEEYVQAMLEQPRAGLDRAPEPDPEDLVMGHLKELVEKYDFIESIDLSERMDLGYRWQITSKYKDFRVADMIEDQDLILGIQQPFGLVDRIVASHNHELMRAVDA